MAKLIDDAAAVCFRYDRAIMNGVLNLDKPAGITSARAVAMVKRLLPRGTKVGHAGTLDPFATGVLLLLIGRATKKCETLMGQPKQYEATIKLGVTTPTLDPESPEEPLNGATRSVENISAAMIVEAMATLTGDVEQQPPLYSALKVAGQRAADRVRAGELISLQPRIVRIEKIELLDYSPPLARVKVDCGRGTYVRAIARDLGETLGVGGYLTQLRRTRIGNFDASKAMQLDAITLDAIEKHLA